ncbi:T9SS type A sorting domain-containing protein [Flammeovirgaceae bacterium SG7u.111]|nr:T9SS type A sorting domain-containing protein [Flammeovirgaceae bacterium SG7u.132]WPO34189.1 T9SS type A sorting domain-containing protein [Flammeovirgaceae bacterium SG7u.111]
MKRKTTFITLVYVMLVHALLGANYYISPSGNDSNSGTLQSPFATLNKAISVVSPGDYIYLRGGTYSYSSTILIAESNSGSSSSPIRVFAYNSETPVLDFSGQSLSSSNRGVVQDAAYWHWKGVTIQGAGDNGMLLSGDNNTIENCVFRGNRDTGLQLSRYNTNYDAISEWPSNNLITGCEAYDNADPDSEDADGFAAKLTCGVGNKFINCISHHNIDDGWDLYTKSDTGPIGVVYFEGCIAHSNGTLTSGATSGNGDKNGYKLGSSAHNINHILRRCVAFNNGKHGFADNGNVGSIEFTNCTSYSNTQYNFHTRDGASHIFKNNLSFNSSSNDRIRGNASAPNAFDNDDNWPYTASSSDFVTLNSGPNNNPTSNGFLTLSSGSSLIDAGVSSTGISYNGNSPDLGAVESGGTPPPPGTYTLTTSVRGQGSVSPDGGSFTAGSTVTVTATPANGWTFSNWSGGYTGNPATVTMDADKSIVAVFTEDGVVAPPPSGDYVHNFTASGTSSSFYSISGNLSTSKGTVVYNGLTLTQCLKIESSTSISFSAAQEATLTLVFNDGFNGDFKIDGNDYTVSSGVLTTTLGAGSHTLSKSDVANLYYMSLAYAGGGTTQYTVSASSNGNGSVSGGGTFDEGSVISLTAIPNSGYQFVGWSGNASGTSNPLSVTVNGNKSIAATFSAIPTNTCENVVYQAESGTWDDATVDSNHAGYTGSGFVNTANAAGKYVEITVDVPSAGDHDVSIFYANGSTDRPADISVNGSTQLSNLSLPNTGAWSTWLTADFTVSLNSGSNTIRFTATGGSGLPNVDKIEVCQFDDAGVNYSLSTTINGSGSVSPSSGIFAAGTSVIMTATPASGWQFDSWSGGYTGNPATVVMDADKNITANFTSVSSTAIALSASASDGTVNLSWVVSNGTVTGQQIYRDTDSDPSGRVRIAQGVAGTSYTDNSVSNGTTYYYWVKASDNGNGATINSNAANATPTGVVVPPIGNGPIGYASMAGGTTGGQGGVSYNCSTGDCITTYIHQKRDGDITVPLTIYVTGTITPGNSTTAENKIEVKDVRDVSIIGVGTSGVFDGIGIKIYKAGNVIIQNVAVGNVLVGDKDAISIEGPADHVWIDHCELYAEYQNVGKDYYDGLLDAKKDSEYITYSYNYLHDSWKMMLVGNGDGDDYDRKITIHHNYFDNVNSRMPLFRHGVGHIFSNYYSGVVSTGINSRMGACLKVENNYFKDSQNPIVSAYSDELGGTQESGNIFDNVTWDLSRDDTSEPNSCSLSVPYSYSSALTGASSVPATVIANAGVGKIGANVRNASGGFIQLEEIDEFVIYPNPVANMLNLDIPTLNGNEELRIVTLSGREVLKQKISDHSVSLDVSTLPSGVYVLQLKTGAHTNLKMMIKQ